MSLESRPNLETQDYMSRAGMAPIAVAVGLLLFGLFYFGGADERTRMNSTGEQILQAPGASVAR